MKLALALGYGSVESLLYNLSYSELLDWQAYYSIEPFPEEREDIRNGLLMSLFHNMWRSEDTQAKDFTEFVPDYWNMEDAVETKKQAPDEMLQTAMMINAAFGNKVVKKE